MARTRFLLACVLLGWFYFSGQARQPSLSSSLHEQPALRHPVSLGLSERGEWLLVANRRSGTLSLVDTQRLRVREEVRIGATLSDLARVADLPGPLERYLVLDEERHELRLLEVSGPAPGRVRAVGSVAVSPYPVSVRMAPDGRFCVVASLWSGHLSFVDLARWPHPRVVKTLPLPFAPRQQVMVPGTGRLVVADSFGGRLAVVDLSLRRIERVFELPAHNIRGLAVSTRSGHLLVAHQSLDPSARANREDIRWGVFMSNSLTSLPLAEVLSSRNVLYGMRTLPLGEPSGDPQDVVVGEDGGVGVALGGVGRVAVGRLSWPQLDHVGVGRRPTGLAFGSDGRLYVANTFSDSISVLDPGARRVLADIPLGPVASLSPEEEGERLFYDANLSLRGWMSCHSCHTDGHASGGLADTLGDGGYGAPKRIPSLLAVGDSGPWAWNGSRQTLAEQVHKSLENTLQHRSPSPEQVQALEAFLRGLQPPSLPLSEDPGAVRKGEEVFRRQGCHRCHAPPAYTSTGTRDVGLADKAGNRRFNPPSLRGVRHRSSFLHDGRARTLKEVFQVHPQPLDLPPEDLSHLIAFLSTL